MRILLVSLVSIVFFSLPAVAGNGLVSIKSHYDVKVTADRLEKTLKAKGMTVFTRIDHADAAEKVGIKLRPTELVIFGNPRVGSPLMKCGQSAGIDLPQKALIWKDEGEHVWLSYNDPEYLAKRHGIKGCDGVIKKISNALGNFARAATRE